MNHADILISVGLVLRAFSSEDLITLSVYMHLNQREIKSCICSHEIQMTYSINVDVLTMYKTRHPDQMHPKWEGHPV